jgi:hypothetical protein
MAGSSVGREVFVGRAVADGWIVADVVMAGVGDASAVLDGWAATVAATAVSMAFWGWVVGGAELQAVRKRIKIRLKRIRFMRFALSRPLTSDAVQMGRVFEHG